MSDERTMFTIKGRAFQPGKSRAVKAELRISGGSGEIVGPDNQQLAHFMRPDLKFEAPIGSAARRATLSDGTLFETDDHEAVQDLTGKNHGSTLHWLEGFHPRLILVLAGCIAGVWFIWRYGLDIIAAAAVAMTPAPVAEAIDTGILQSLDYAFAAPSTISVEEQERTREIFTRLLAELDPEEREKFDFQLEFRAMDGLGPNAIALPNGTVIITDRLLELFTAEDLRAGVIGHELGHVVEQHGLRQLYRSLGIAVLVALLAGDTGPIVEDIVLEGNAVLALSFSRESERAADAFGVKITQKAGYNPEGLIQFFDYVASEYGDGSSWLSTHPSSSERVQEIRRMIAK